MDNTKPTLYLIRGVSGAGKSTFANTLLDAGIVSEVAEADNWFICKTGDKIGEYVFKPEELKAAHEYCKFRTGVCLINRKSVAVSNTSTRSQDVEQYQDLAAKYDANFVSLIIENRNKTQSIHNVPPLTRARQRAQFAIQL
jgi:predicted kinase